MKIKLLLRLHILVPAIVIMALSSFSGLEGAVIKGKVIDGKTKEILIGALLFCKDNDNMHDASGLDGSYAIKNAAPGNYTLVVNYIGYVQQEKSVTIKNANETVTIDFLLLPTAVQLNEVSITGSYDQGSDNYARSLEKNSENVLNIMSAKTIQLMPDVTIGDVLQRVSGVTVERAPSGEGRYAIIRGMDKRYNYTMIDGIKIPSPDNKNRYIPMDIFPSELVERLEVIKTLTPSMEGDAIGGVMNLVLKDAPPKFLFNANVGTGYSQMDFDQKYSQFDANVINNNSPQQLHPNTGATLADFPLKDYVYNSIQPAPNIYSNFSIGNRFDHDKLGVIVSASYQNTFSQTKSFFLNPDAQPNPAPTPNSTQIDDIEARNYYTEQTRAAVHARLDYDFNKNNSISFYTVYTSLDEIRHRHISDTLVLNKHEVDQHDESKVTDQSIYNGTLHGEHTLIRNLKFDWTGAYSEATSTTPDWGELTTTGNDSNSTEYWQKFTRRWLSNTDKDYSGYANLTYNFKLDGKDVELKTGGMDRNKNRDNYYDDYSLAFTASQPAVTTLNVAQISGVSDPFGSPTDANNYSVHENVFAYFGQAKIMLGNRIQILGGVREENTYLNYVTAESIYFLGQNGNISYNDILPSASFKYNINDQQNLRASYFSSLTRPGFFEVIPYTITGEYYDETGNPYLKHTTADNYDLRYELFPKPSEQILIGAFYKDIYNPIEYALIRPTDKPSAQDLEPENFGNATNYGLEFVISKYIRHWGVSANYTYTHSQITTDKALYSEDASGQEILTTVSQTRPLQGQADNIANLSLIYKNPKINLDMYLTGVYTGKLISTVSPDYGLDQWQMPMTRLDFSFEKRISKKINLNLYGKVNNILNTALIIRIIQPVPESFRSGGSVPLPEQDDQNNSILVQKEQYGQSYILGIRYKFQ